MPSGGRGCRCTAPRTARTSRTAPRGELSVAEDWKRAGGAEGSAADVDVVGRGVETHLGEAGEDRLHGDGGLHARQVHAEAGVGAEGDRDVLEGRAEGVGLLRSGPALP